MQFIMIAFEFLVLIVTTSFIPCSLSLLALHHISYSFDSIQFYMSFLLYPIAAMSPVIFCFFVSWFWFEKEMRKFIFTIIFFIMFMNLINL